VLGGVERVVRGLLALARAARAPARVRRAPAERVDLRLVALEQAARFGEAALRLRGRLRCDRAVSRACWMPCSVRADVRADLVVAALHLVQLLALRRVALALPARSPPRCGAARRARLQRELLLARRGVALARLRVEVAQPQRQQLGV
jgi:hypothetical protein